MVAILKHVRSARTLVLAAVAAAAALACPSSASAGLTELRSTQYSTEQNQSQILSHKYGGTFTASGDSFTNGTITATRVDDAFDKVWGGSKLTLTPVAAFAGSNESLGLYLSSGSTGTAQTVYTSGQFGYLSDAPVTMTLGTQPWRFALDNETTNLRSSSFGTETGLGDHLITYKIDGLSGEAGGRYMLFWEDSSLNVGDRDYNDLVVEAKFAGRGGPMAVPLPPAAVLGLATMGGIAGIGYWKRRRTLRTA